MNRQVFFLSILYLTFNFGCAEKEQHSTLHDSTAHKIVSDSLLTLDSLIMVNRVAFPGTATQFGRLAVKMALKTSSSAFLIKAYTLNGNAWSLSAPNSAFINYMKAIEAGKDLRGFPEKAMILYNIAMLHYAASDVKNAMILLDSAILLAGRHKNYRVVSNSLNALGNLYSDLGHDSLAFILYDSAFRIAQNHHLPLQMASALGNLAGQGSRHLEGPSKGTGGAQAASEL